MRSRCRSASRRSRSPGMSAHARQRSERSPCSAATSLTSAAPRRVSPIFVRPCSSPRRSVIASAWNERTSTCTDALTMLGRPRESARLAQSGLEAMRRYGIESALLVSNQVEALLAIGDWDEAERLSAAGLRGITSSFPYCAPHVPRDGRDRPRRLRRRPSAPRGRERRRARGPRAWSLPRATSPTLPSGSAAGRTRTRLSSVGLARARQHEDAQIRVQLCAQGMRAQAELAALARARRNSDAIQGWLDRARTLIGIRSRRRSRGLGDHAERRRLAGLGRGRVQARLRSSIRPNVVGGSTDVGAARTLARSPPTVAGAQAEALVAAGASRTEAGAPLREAHAVAARIGAKPLARRSSSCSPSARGSISRRPEAVVGRREAGAGRDPRADSAGSGGA